MTGKAHLSTGLACGVIAAGLLDYDVMSVVGMCALGSIIVDIDAPNSMINKVIPGSVKTKNFIKILLGGLLIFQKFYVTPIFKYIGVILILSAVCAGVEYRFSLFKGIERRVHHRTIFHDPRLGLLLLIVPLKFLKIANKLVLAYIIGLISHYILDWLTVYGLPLYGTKKRFIRSPVFFKSNNKLIEFIIMLSSVCVVLYNFNKIISCS